MYQNRKESTDADFGFFMILYTKPCKKNLIHKKVIVMDSWLVTDWELTMLKQSQKLFMW